MCIKQYINIEKVKSANKTNPSDVITKNVCREKLNKNICQESDRALKKASTLLMKF